MLWANDKHSENNAFNGFPIESCFDDDLKNRITFEIILEVLEQNKFDLILLSQHEFEEVSKLIEEFKKQIAHCSK